MTPALVPSVRRTISSLTCRPQSHPRTSRPSRPSPGAMTGHTPRFFADTLMYRAFTAGTGCDTVTIDVSSAEAADGNVGRSDGGERLPILRHLVLNAGRGEDPRMVILQEVRGYLRNHGDIAQVNRRVQVVLLVSLPVPVCVGGRAQEAVRQRIGASPAYTCGTETSR